MLANWGMVASLLFTSVLASFLGLLILSLLNGPRPSVAQSVFAMGNSGITFLFDGEMLLDATPAARALLAESPVRGTPWLRLLARLGPRFGDLEQTVLDLPKVGQITLQSLGPKDGPEELVLMAESVGGVTRLTLTGAGNLANGEPPSALLHRAQGDELGELRQVIAQAPVLIWREREDGEVIWANSTYLMLVADRLEPGQELSWPLPRLFDRLAASQGANGQRQRLDIANAAPRWFDVVGFAQGPNRLVFGLSADNAVQAETTLRDFTQTLSKTFAHLPVGLAVFDRNRKLQLFNPALSELTALQPEFLIARPSLVSFLDAMREKSMIPEPKDYRSWRRQMVELEAAASSGVHEETWNLPSGQTYRVIGRPHPNGAVALMFEDISTEILRTRRYRADLELSQAVIDMMDDGIAVFSSTGSLVMTNAAYTRLWQHNPSADLSDVLSVSMVRHWQSLSAPTTLWASAEEFLALLGDREPWDGQIRLTDGRLVGCKFSPLVGGATMVAFQLLLPDQQGVLAHNGEGLLSA
jgi:PAS domain-containing protein